MISLCFLARYLPMLPPLSRRKLLLTAAGVAVSLPAIAQARLAPPSGAPLLTVSGKIERSNGVDGVGNPVALFDSAMLEAFPQHSQTSDTWWDTAVHQYRGPLLRDVLSACGVEPKGRTLRAQALNDYAIDLPADDVLRWPVFLALFIDNERLPRRARGPLWIMYPRRGDPDLENQITRDRWVWQLSRIVVS
jgi:hypothetical protein